MTPKRVSMTNLGGSKDAFLLVLGLVDFAKSAVSQLAHDVPNILWLHIADDQILRTGLTTT